MTKTWGIVGLGWLGSELAIELEKQNFKHWGTRTNTFNFQTDEFPQTFCDVLFLNTPPLINLPPSEFVDKIKIPSATAVIFISSTSTYGNSAGTFTESSQATPVTESARWMGEVETKLREKFSDRLTIIRPGGLIGGNRHPVYALSRKKEVKDGGQTINLIHRSDLIRICLAAYQAGNIRLVNAVTPYHPTKKEYYSQWTKKLNLPDLVYSGESTLLRQIDSEVLPTLYPQWVCPKLDFI